MPEPSPASLPFVIEVRGRFEPGQILVTHDPAPRTTTAQLEELIAAEWRRQTVLARKDGRLMFNGDLLRYDRHEVTPDAGGGERLHLTVGPTCYRDFVGTNLYNAHRLGDFGWDHFSNPLGTTATLITSDNRIFLGRRSTRVAYHGEHVLTFGGALEGRDRARDSSIDPFAGLCRELAEELALARDQLDDLCCVGLIRDKEIHQPELLFEARLSMTAEALQHRWESAEARDEHAEIVTLPDQEEAVVPFIRARGPIAPVAIGALFLHGLRRWGESWSHQAAAALARTPRPESPREA